MLGFTFFDLWARIKTIGADSAWSRLGEILQWQDEVRAAGGYRKYYQGGKYGTLQGCGTPGGLGIDCEFYESSLLPSIVVYGFIGINPDGSELQIHPNLPKASPEIGIQNLLYRNCRLDILTTPKSVTVALKDQPVESIRIALPKGYRIVGTQQGGNTFELGEPGVYRWES